jgi:hypothetical protein
MSLIIRCGNFFLVCSRNFRIHFLEKQVEDLKQQQLVEQDSKINGVIILVLGVILLCYGVWVISGGYY